MEHLPKPIRAVAVLVAAVMAAGLTGAAASSTSSTSVASRSSSSALQGAAPAEARPGTIDSRVRGEFGRNGTVRGTFSPVRWIHRGGETYAVGRLHATLRRGNGTLVGTANRQISLPLRNGTVIETARQPCDILNLVLGPLDLNLLGLHVTLNRVRLHIEAIPGPGNLLGNLLCAVAGLLDQTSLLGELRLTNLLNRILGLVR